MEMSVARAKYSVYGSGVGGGMYPRWGRGNMRRMRMMRKKRKRKMALECRY
jgi:hypothetical protein